MVPAQSHSAATMHCNVSHELSQVAQAGQGMLLQRHMIMTFLGPFDRGSDAAGLM